MSDERIRILPKSLKPKPTGRRISLGVGDNFSKAALEVTGAAPVPTPAQAMAIEHTKLLKVFRGVEGRDPNPDADPEFWDAYQTIFRMRTDGGVSKDSSPVKKADDTAVSEKLRKRIEDGPSDGEPPWLQAIIDRHKSDT